MSDYISRWAAMKLLKEAEYKETSLNVAGAMICAIRDLPAADVAPVVHGHFGKKTSPFNAPCSVCGASMNTYWNYCPNCGAKIDGGKKSEHTD